MQLPPGYDQPLSLLAYNTGLREALYPQAVAEQATATQKVLGAVGGAVLAVGDFGRETVDSTVSLARNFIAAGMYQWGIADRLGVREQSGIYHDQLGESVAALVGLASVEGVGKVWNHYSGQYSQAATLWKRGDADSIIAASRTATKASLEVGSIATGAYGAIKLTVSGLRTAGTFAQGERAMLATMEGAAYGSWRAQLGAVGDLKGVKPFGATQANDMIRADVAATGRIEVVPNRTALVDFSSGEIAPGFYRADPRQLRFTQSDASPNFIDPVTKRPIGTISSLVDELRAGRVTADQVGKPLQVVMYEGKPFSIDNRRLAGFNAAGVPDVSIEIVSLKDPAVATRFFNRFDPIRGEGYNIVITPTSGRVSAQTLLRDQGLIKGVQLGH